MKKKKIPPNILQIGVTPELVPQDSFSPVEVLSWLSKDTQFKVLMHQLHYNQGDLRFFPFWRKTLTNFLAELGLVRHFNVIAQDEILEEFWEKGPVDILETMNCF